MKRFGAALALAALLGMQAARASDNADVIRRCIEAAAHGYRVPPVMLVILLKVEGGSLGAVSRNSNGTVDIGPMQVNEIWLPEVAAHWRTTQRTAFVALRDSFCANLEAGTWILRQGLDEANGDFWEGVGYYHSHDPAHKRAYLHAVLQQALRLEDERKRSPAPGTSGAKG